MYFSGQISTPGKWILTGEHAVLRGKTAIVFPIPSRRFILNYKAGTAPLEISFGGEGITDILRQSFQKGMHRALEYLHLNQNGLTGHVHIRNQIPVGSGMGASAALSVTLAKWFVALGKLEAKSVSECATYIEHLYHGCSSGLDIAGVQSENGIFFSNNHCIPLEMKWHPQWALSFCGEVSNTAQCIAQVQRIRDQDSILAGTIDEQMQYSSDMALQALRSNSETGLHKLARAMRLALQCFEQWKLISPPMQRHLNDLYERGAIAAKPTGSGGGGHVISLWDNAPPADLHRICFDKQTSPVECSSVFGADTIEKFTVQKVDHPESGASTAVRGTPRKRRYDGLLWEAP